MEKTVQVKHCVELINSSTLPSVKFAKQETAIKIAQIMQAARVIIEAPQAYNAQRAALVDEFALLDADDKPQQNPDGTLKFANGAKQRSFEQKQRELLDAETTIHIPSLKNDDLQADNLTPMAVFPLLPFINMPIDW